MANPLYAWAFSDPFHSIFIGVTSVFSLLSNTLLMSITFSSAAEHMGTYRYLLAFFACCDITTTMGHAVLQPYLHLTSTGFYFFPREPGNMIFDIPVDNIFCLAFIATYYQTFLILAYHFVYRYRTVTRGLSAPTSRWSAHAWFLLGFIVFVLYITGFLLIVIIGMLPSEETRKAAPTEIKSIYGIDLADTRNGFTVLAMKTPTGDLNVVPIASAIMAVSLITATATVILFCIYHINAVLRSADSLLSTTTKRMHRQLFNALLIQASPTAVPCVFSYAPLAIVLLWPITGISLGAFGNVLFLTTAIFPSIDAFFVIYFIRSFRAAVIQIFRLPCQMESSIEPSGTELTTTAGQRY